MTVRFRGSEKYIPY